MSELTPRWYPLREHAEQLRLLRSPARFRVVAAGRRSGKTERGKRRLVRKALEAMAQMSKKFIDMRGKVYLPEEQAKANKVPPAE